MLYIKCIHGVPIKRILPFRWKWWWWWKISAVWLQLKNCRSTPSGVWLFIYFSSLRMRHLNQDHVIYILQLLQNNKSIWPERSSFSRNLVFLARKWKMTKNWTGFQRSEIPTLKVDIYLHKLSNIMLFQTLSRQGCGCCLSFLGETPSLPFPRSRVESWAFLEP